MADWVQAATSAFGTFMNYKSQRETNEQNKALYYDNQAFAERMTRNAHQYEVEDLKAAGLNPILSAGGSGASTPSVSTPHLEAPKIDPMAIATTAKMWEDKKLSKAMAHTQMTEQDKNRAQEELLNMQKDLLRTQLSSAKNMEAVENTSFGRGAAFFKKFFEVFSPAVSSAKSAIRLGVK